MTRSRVRLGSVAVAAVAAAATTWTTMLSWRGFTAAPDGFLVQLAVVAFVVAAVGAVGRWRRLPTTVVLLAEIAVGGALVCWLVAGQPWPGSAFTEAMRAATDAANLYPSPVPENDAVTVHPLLLAGGFAAVVGVDLLACGLRRVPLAGLPLLTVYSVPISMLDRGLDWWIFALSALGFLLLLYLQEQQTLDRWGRSLDDPASPEQPTDRRGPAAVPARTGRSAVVRLGAVAVSTTTVAAAVLVPLAVPTLDLRVFDFGAGPGGGTEISIENPMVDLRRDLRRGEDVPLIDIVTDDPSPAYLRISVLNRFSDNEWSSGDRDVPADQLAQGSTPPLVGVLPTASRDYYDYQVQIDDAFESTWLPTQAPISRIEAPGDWRYDVDTMDFIAAGDDDDLTTAGLSYSMTAVELDLDAAVLGLAPAAPTDLDDETLAVPDSVPDSVRDLARAVTASADGPFARAQALQSFFRDDGRFTYSLDDGTPVGNGVDDLAAFLDPNGPRTGYCEQFAAAMAVMARIVGVPARVAVGFLKPDPVDRDRGEWIYSAHDLHAWPELYLDGFGWVTFDPTPRADDADVVPSYTTVNAPPVSVPTDDTGVEASPSASSQPTGDGPTSAPSRRAPELPGGGAGPSSVGRADVGGFSGLALAGCLLLVVLLAAAALVPRSVRRRQRAARLVGGPESVWQELRATARDLGLPWPEQRSPRETQHQVVALFGRPDDPDPAPRPRRGPDQCPEAVAALARIVDLLERLRYAPRGQQGEAASLRADTELVLAALRAGVQPRLRTRAEWLPRSVTDPRSVDRQLDLSAAEAGLVVERV